MKKLCAILLVVFICVTMLAACTGKTAEPTAEGSQSSAPAQEIIVASPEEEQTSASAEEVSLEGLETLDDVLAYLNSVLPYEGDGDLIPYEAKIYHAGDNTMTWELQGLCTRDGHVVIKPVFSQIYVAENIGTKENGQPDRAYFAEIAGNPESTAVISPNGKLLGWAMEMQDQYSGLSWDETIIPTGGWDVAICDDGKYYIDGYVVHEESDGYVYGDLEWKDEGYEICRKSDGAKFAHTDWYGLLINYLPDGGRVYYTVDDGFICTYDESFHLILRVPDEDGGRRKYLVEFKSQDEENTSSAPASTSSFHRDNLAAHTQEVRYGEYEELKELYELATEIGNRYGINIYIGDLVPTRILEDGNMLQCDPVLVKRSLNSIDEILGAYPAGFFDQLVYGDFAALDLYLVGFSPVGMGYISSLPENGDDWTRLHSFICIDAEEDVLIDEFPYTLTHEITHLIDERLQYVSEREAGHLFSEEAWSAMNPEGFRYAWDDSDLELDMYDRYYEYFAYSYGAKNSLEDRATLFGSLMRAVLEGNKDYEVYQPCLDKLTFYFRCIRDGFDTEGWQEETIWEQKLSSLVG